HHHAIAPRQVRFIPRHRGRKKDPAGPLGAVQLNGVVSRVMGRHSGGRQDPGNGGMTKKASSPNPIPASEASVQDKELDPLGITGDPSDLKVTAAVRAVEDRSLYRIVVAVLRGIEGGALARCLRLETEIIIIGGAPEGICPLDDHNDGGTK